MLENNSAENDEKCAAQGNKWYNPRRYQDVLLQFCIEDNTILYLPTGAGKTFIAVMLIRKMMEKCLEEPDRKIGIFAANTVALVDQQAEYIKRHTDLRVGTYTGVQNVDMWNREKWGKEFATHEVLVMSSQVVFNVLQHGYLSAHMIQVIVFDECHRAVSDHPMKKVMDILIKSEANPRVLGLTGTLLNSNCKRAEVISMVKALETTFRSKIATILDSEEIKSYSTNAEEMSIEYENSKQHRVAENAIKMLDDCEKFILLVDFNTESELQVEGPDNSKLMFDKAKTNKKLRNVLRDVTYHINEIGLFGGYLTTLLHKIELIRLEKHAESSVISLVHRAMITTLHCVGKMLFNEMQDTPQKDRVHAFSSNKLLKLLACIEKMFSNQKKTLFNESERDEKRPKFTVLVFVERRSSAKLLYQILKILSTNHPNFETLHPDFVVGFAAQQFTKENDLEKKRNQAALDRFKNGETNIIVSSDVLEEGVDIPMCNTVIRFDKPKSFRSYVQSKGRARHKTSTFHVLMERGDKIFSSQLSLFKEIENELYMILKTRASIVNDPYEEDELVMDETDDEMWTVPGGVASVTVSTALIVISMYCDKLPQDKFSDLQPLWYIHFEGDGTCSCYVKMPMSSGLKEPVKGKPKNNRKIAKRYAAFEAVKQLYFCGELDEHLSAVSYEANVMSYLTSFPLIKREPVPKDKPQAGTKKRKQLYPIKTPDLLCGCQPRPHRPTYMHLIEVTPSYSVPPNDKPRKIAFYKMFNEKNGYAILTSERLPRLCDFPIFSNEGQMDVKITYNYKEYILTKEDVRLCLDFRKLLFGRILELLKDFMVFNDKNEENCYFVVPVVCEDGACGYDIDWKVLQNHRKIETVTRKSIEDRSVPVEDYNIYHKSVVVPWYRGLPPALLYIVTKVCEDMTPQTPFPTLKFSSYEEYFVSKYSLQIIEKNQPLLEVKSIPKLSNWLKPRSTPENVQHMSKRKCMEQQKDFEEHLVPELCTSYSFPGCLWLKAIYLPTILHRITQMLCAEEFRSMVARETGLGHAELPSDIVWKPLKQETAAEEPPEVEYASAQPTKDDFKPSDDTPVDLDRTLLYDIAGIDILDYDYYCNGGTDTFKSPKDLNHIEGIPLENGFESTEKKFFFMGRKVPAINILSSHNNNNTGPELGEVVQALTTASSHDIFNSERLETLGDSFLKFTTALFLFLHFDRLGEGALTTFKNHIVGNSHFYNIARQKKIGDILNVHEFTPKDAWMPPGIIVPENVCKLMLEQTAPATILYELQLSEEEQQAGIVSEDTINKLKENIEASQQDPNLNVHSSMEDYLGVHSIPDKSMADAVEALIGVYLNDFGVEGALKFVNWLQILPEKEASPDVMFHQPPPSPIYGTGSLSDIKFHLENAHRLEKIIGYEFKNKAYLLQALTHATYIQNRITDCYQRLEFLGDAVLDFLVTSYLFETYTELTPGQLTDLRSALVNNNTFAAYSVKYSFHKYCRYSSLELFHKVDSFVRYQEAHNHEVTDEILLLLDEDDTLAEAVDVPKVLGDLFESMAGAIFLDSGKCLRTVWNVYYQLMKNEIYKFAANIPKSAIRLLYEKCSKQRPEFSKSTQTSEPNILAVRVDIILQDEKKSFYGFGTTKKAAKTAAAKAAIKVIDCREQKL